MLVTSFWIVDLLILLTAVIYLVYKYSTRKYDYFKKRNIPYSKPVAFFGNMLPLVKMKTSAGPWLRDVYNSVDAPCFGVFMFDEPHLIIKSPEIVKQILIKDFNKFFNRSVHAPNHSELISSMMFVQRNPEWRVVRKRMTPVFTSGKLREMAFLIDKLARDLTTHIKSSTTIVDSKEVCAKYFTDVVSKCAFGIEANALKSENSEMRKLGRSFFEFTLRNVVAQNAYFFKPSLVKFLKLDLFDKKTLTALSQIFWETIGIREQTNIKGHDVIDAVVEIRKNKNLCNELNFDGDKAVAQAVIFFAAGYETTSSTLSFALYELAINPEVQDRLREEIINCINNNGGITYDVLNEMKYMELCIYETLRKYPALPFLDRTCNEECKLVGTDITVEKGLPIYIPTMGLHYDEKYFPEPEKFDPERFADKNSYNVNGLYFVPFGDGPRICIGERFGMLGVKMGLTHILSQFIVESVPETPIPIKFEPRSLVLQSTVGLPLKYREIQPPLVSENV